MALNTDIAGTATDSYVTLAEFSTIGATLVELVQYGIDQADLTAFEAASVATQEEVARLSANNIDTAAYDGVKFTDAQIREWPRTRTRRPDLREGTIVPREVLLAQVADGLKAFALKSDNQEALDSNIASFSLAEQSVSFNTKNAFKNANIHNSAKNILEKGNLLRGGVSSVRMRRG